MIGIFTVAGRGLKIHVKKKQIIIINSKFPGRERNALESRGNTCKEKAKQSEKK